MIVRGVREMEFEETRICDGYFWRGFPFPSFNCFLQLTSTTNHFDLGTLNLINFHNI